MFGVIYRFEVKEGMGDTFLHSWEKLTELIYQYEGSYGSRIHRAKKNEFIAYALWPDKTTWENSGSHLPEEADEFKRQMKESCVQISTEHELTIVKDLIQTELYKKDI